MTERRVRIQEFLAPAPLWENQLLNAKETLSLQDRNVIDQYRALHSFLFGIGDSKTKYRSLLQDGLGIRPDEQTHFRFHKFDWIAYADRPSSKDIRDFFDLRWRALLRAKKHLYNRSGGQPTQEQARLSEEIKRSKLAYRAMSRNNVRESRKNYLPYDDPGFQAVFAIFKDESQYINTISAELAAKQKTDPISFLSRLLPGASRNLGQKSRNEQAIDLQQKACARTFLTICTALLPSEVYDRSLQKFTSDVVDLNITQMNPEISLNDHIRFAPADSVINRSDWTDQYIANNN